MDVCAGRETKMVGWKMPALAMEVSSWEHPTQHRGFSIAMFDDQREEVRPSFLMLVTATKTRENQNDKKMLVLSRDPREQEKKG